MIHTVAHLGLSGARLANKLKPLGLMKSAR